MNHDMHAEYLGRFSGRLSAMEFEQTVLNVGREFLPACALAVLDGEDGTEAYYEFLIEQHEIWTREHPE